MTPQISPESPTGEIYRYILKVPKDRSGHDIYTLNDLKALQDWVLEREFRTVPRIVDVTSFGGTVRRYEVQPDPDRLRRYGITLRPACRPRWPTATPPWAATTSTRARSP